jgi:hypothetical protein
MSSNQTIQRFTAWRSRRQVWWMTVAVFAIVIAYVDGFIVTSLQGAVGAIERREPLFGRWLRDSTLMLPLFFLAVLAAFVIARRWVGQGHRGFVKYGTTALLIVLLTSGVAIGEAAASSAYDYHLQTRHLEQQHQMMSHSDTAALQGSVDQPMGDMPMGAAGSTMLEASKQDTLNVHLKALRLGSMALLISNLVLVLWVSALRSDRLWRRPEATPMVITSAIPEELSMA